MPERLNGPVLKTGARKCRGFESHPLRHALAALLAALLLASCYARNPNLSVTTLTRRLGLLGVVLLVAACSLLPGRQFVFGFQAQGVQPEVTGVLTDKTGTVTRVTTVQGIDPAPPIDRGMMTFADRPNSVLAHWIGGACDENLAILVTPDGGTTITVTPGSPAQVCDMVGIQRYVMIEFANPVDVMQTTIKFEP